MLSKPPIEIPGGPIREPDRPESKRCPKCKRTFNRYEYRNGKRYCPKCGKEI